MKIESLENYGPGNPFLFDAYNMGIEIGNNVTIMMGNHKNEECKYVIIVNTDTGERIRVTL